MFTCREFRCKHRTKGFSLFELIMVMVVLGIVAAVSAPFLSASFQSYFIGKDISEIDSQARAALERLSRELRSIRAPTDLTISPSSEVTFTDVDGNSIRYCLGTVAGCPGAAGELMRNSQPLATGISALAFSYLTRNGTAAAAAANVFYVTVSFTATQNTVSKAFTATVSPRNFP